MSDPDKRLSKKDDKGYYIDITGSIIDALATSDRFHDRYVLRGEIADRVAEYESIILKES